MNPREEYQHISSDAFTVEFVKDIQIADANLQERPVVVASYHNMKQDFLYSKSSILNSAKSDEKLTSIVKFHSLKVP